MLHLNKGFTACLLLANLLVFISVIVYQTCFVLYLVGMMYRSHLNCPNKYLEVEENTLKSLTYILICLEYFFNCTHSAHFIELKYLYMEAHIQFWSLFDFCGIFKQTKIIIWFHSSYNIWIIFNTILFIFIVKDSPNTIDKFQPIYVSFI